jgi:hypothetical protein
MIRPITASFGYVILISILPSMDRFFVSANALGRKTITINNNSGVVLKSISYLPEIVFP